MIGQIRRFNSFGALERAELENFAFDAEVLGVPLSGYLAGKKRGGDMVCRLEDRWEEAFHVKHSIAVNSATSGLLAASYAIGLKRGEQFSVPAMTMSATAAAPMFTGATPIFCDVDEETFGLSAATLPYEVPANWPVFTANLFGHPSDLYRLRKWCDANATYLIEDNAQSPFAMADGRFAGTIGHIGVFSLNIHKPLQCGEGGIIVTNDDALADKMRDFINHGEVNGGPIGLNLRMTEATAAIAKKQLRYGPEIIRGRIEQAEAIIAAIGDIPGLRPPVVREGCRHVYYTIPFLIDGGRPQFCAALKAQGVPIVEGYVEPLYNLPAFNRFWRHCPVADSLHGQRLFYIENCRWDFSPGQVKEIGDAFKRAAEEIS